VLRVLLRDEPLAAGVSIASIASATEGYSGSDLEQLCKTTAMSAVEELLQAEVAREAEAEARRHARREARPCAAAPPSTPPRTPQPGERCAVPTEAAEPKELEELEHELPPLPPLRRLTLDDFLRARAVVRPTRGRFEGVDHGLGIGVAEPVPAEYDESLYD